MCLRIFSLGVIKITSGRRQVNIVMASSLQSLITVFQSGFCIRLCQLHNTKDVPKNIYVVMLLVKLQDRVQGVTCKSLQPSSFTIYIHCTVNLHHMVNWCRPHQFDHGVSSTLSPRFFKHAQNKRSEIVTKKNGVKS